MSTLTPSSGRRRRRGRAFSVIVVGLLALVAGGAIGWSLTHRDPDPVAPPTSTGCPTPQPSGSGATSPAPSGSPVVSRSVKPATSPKPLPSPATITVDVFNATDRQGLAKTTAKQLEQRGFRIGDIANDPSGRTVAGTAIVRYGPKGKSQAIVVAAQVPSAKLVNDKRADRSVSLVLGDGFDALATPEAAAAALAPTPAPSC